MVKDYLISPAIPLLPGITLIIYNIVVTMYVILFLMGLLVALWRLFTEGRKHLTSKDLRSELREKMGRWPTSKWDILVIVGATYSVATMVPLVVLMLVLPRGRLSGVISGEEAQTILVSVLAPLLLIFIAIFVRLMFETYREVRSQWVSGTSRERITLVSAISFLLVVWIALVAGDLAGWDSMLWFNGD